MAFRPIGRYIPPSEARRYSAQWFRELWNESVSLRIVVKSALWTGPITFSVWNWNWLRINYPEIEAPHTSELYQCSSDTRYVHRPRMYTARIPRSTLVGKEIYSRKSLNEIWAKAFYRGRTIQLESRLVQCLERFTDKYEVTWDAGDMGQMGFWKDQQLAHGQFKVKTPPSDNMPLCIEWQMTPPSAIHVVDNVAAMGLPYRLPWGGRQTFEALLEEDKGTGAGEGWVELRYGDCLDYETNNTVNHKKDDKVLPKFFQDMHNLYARWLLHSAVCNLMREEEESLGKREPNPGGGHGVLIRSTAQA